MQIHYLNAISVPVKSWHDGSRMLRLQQEDGRSFCCPREDEGCGKPAQEEAAGIYGINPGCVAELLLWALVMAWLPEQEGKLAGSTGHTWLCPPAWSHPHARSRREKCVIIVINIRNIYCKYSAESDLFTPDTQRCECSAQGCCHVSLPEGCTVLLRVCQGCVGPLSPALVKSRWSVSKAVLTESPHCALLGEFWSARGVCKVGFSGLSCKKKNTKNKRSISLNCASEGAAAGVTALHPQTSLF